MLWLSTLGRFALFDSDPENGGVRQLGPSKPLALIAYLALAPKGRASRDQLLGLFWRDREAERARATLRQTLWALRQQFGEAIIHADGDTIILGVPMEVDSRLFDEAVARDDLDVAWGLYHGAFIPDFAAPGCAEFEQWADIRRTRLATAWEKVGRQRITRAMEAGAPGTAADLAAILRDASPLEWDFWRLRLEALLLVGDQQTARVEADTLQEQLRLAGERPPVALRALLARLERRTSALSVESSAPWRSELVGREAALATLVRAWVPVSQGRGAVCTLRGSAGIGKSRLLRAFADRLETHGDTVVAVRSRPADRDVPYTLIASVTQALAQQPGAAGISSATASVLVELVPALAATFPMAARDRFAPQDLPRLRASAVDELLHAVSDEAPVALLIDDLHWADEASRHIMASLAEQLPTMPAFLVISDRPTRRRWTAPSHAIPVELPPLDAEDIGQLLQTVAPCTPTLLAQVAPLLRGATGGVPLLVHAAIDLALERGSLQLHEQRLVCPALERLRLDWRGDRLLETRLAELPPTGLLLLTAIALYRAPLPWALLSTVADPAVLPPILDVLEHRGLIVGMGESWDLGHDVIADAAMQVVAVSERDALAVRMGTALLRRTPPDAVTWQLAGRLLLMARDPQAGRCFQRWLEQVGTQADWRTPILAAVRFLGDDSAVEDAQRLAAWLPRWSRWMQGYPLAAAAILFLLCSGAFGAAIPLTKRLLEPRAARLVVVPPPTSRGFLWDTVNYTARGMPGIVRNPVPLRISFQSANGVPTRNTPSRVRVQVVDTAPGGGWTLHGETDQAVRTGEAWLSDLVLEGVGAFRLRVTADGVPAYVTERMYAEGRYTLSFDARLQLESATINGQALDSLHRVLRVAPNAALVGTLNLFARTVSRASAILMGAVASWGDHRRGFLVLQALPPYGEERFSVSLRDPGNGNMLRAPRTPGRYHLLLVMHDETQMDYIASGTNWQTARPVWDDGNDLADLSPAAIDQLATVGHTEWPWLYPQNPMIGAEFQPLRRPSRLTGTVITVEVASP